MTFWVRYGPENEPEKYSIDLWDKFDQYIGRGTLSLSDVIVNVSSYYPGYPYQKTDRAVMPFDYMCMGSVSLVVEMSGQIAAMSLVNFQDTKDNHHQSWLWWRDFNGNPGSTRDVPGHQMPSYKDVKMKIVTNSSIIQVNISKFSSMS